MYTPEIYYIPIYIFPDLPITRFEIIPGVFFEKYSKKVGEKIKQKNEAWDLEKKVGYSFQPNYNIKIVVKDYAEYQRSQAIRNFGEEKFKKAIEKPEESPDWIQPINVWPPLVAKHVLLSLSLHKLFKFKFGGFFDFNSNLKIGGHANYQLQKSNLLRSIKHVNKNFKRMEISKSATAMNIYFGPYIWLMDRLSIALSSFWSSLCTNQVEQSYLSLTTALESILSTQSHEITHQLAERASFLLSKDPKVRYDIYKNVRSIYKTRSKIVHGKAFLTKKGFTKESAFQSVTHSRVPETDFSKLVQIAQEIIKSSFRNKAFIEIIRSNKNEDKISKKIDDYFIQLITGKIKIT